MQVKSPQQIRNVALAGHADTGKTTLASALLYTGGITNRLLRVEDGNTLTDFDHEEISRGNSIGLAPCFVPWDNHKINLVDTPGSGMFGVEARAGARATDSMLLVVNTVSGVEVMTERMWSYAEELELPVLVHLNKTDREFAKFERALGALNDKFGRAIVPIQIPIGKEHDFSGVIDLVESKAYRYESDGDGTSKESEVPEELREDLEQWRNTLVEMIAETDDELMEEFFEEGTLSAEQLRSGLRKAVLSRQIFPLTIGSAAHNIGSDQLLASLIAYAPDPTERGTFPATDLGGEPIQVETDAEGPAAALVFKTLNDPFSGKISILRVVSGELKSDTFIRNVQAEDGEKIGHLQHLQGKQGTPTQKLVTGDIGGVAKLKHTHSGNTLCAAERPLQLGWIDIRQPAISYAIEPKSKGDEDKIGDAMSRLMEEDLGLHAGRDAQTGELLLSGSGQLHVEIAISRLKTRNKVEIILHPPKVPYRETIRRPAEGHGRHKKQSGGRGQFGDCSIIIEPLPSGSEFEFKDEIFGGSIPQNFRPAVEKGIQAARQRGYLAGCPVVDFRVRLLDGQHHDVDSSEMAFKVAGSLAFKDAMSRAAPTLLEPVMAVEIQTSEEFTGDLISDLSQRRGKPQGMDTDGDVHVIKATVPMSEMLDYAPSMRSITQGRSRFTMEFSHYEEVPKQIQQKIMAEAAAKKAER